MLGANPSHGCEITRAPAATATSTVPSVLPESTTTISSAKAKLARHAGKISAQLYVMMQADSDMAEKGVDSMD